MAGLKPRSALSLEARSLPEGWEMHKDKQGRSYYANKDFGVSFFGDFWKGESCERFRYVN